MKNKKRFQSAVISGLFWVISGIPFALLPASAEKYPVSYGKQQARSYRQRFSVTKPEAKITPADLRPQVSLYHDHFYYDYQPLKNTPLQALPLLLTYSDGRGQGSIGLGWKLLHRFQFRKSLSLDIISPQISYFKNSSGAFLGINTETIPVQPVEEAGKEVLVTTREYHGKRFYFLMPGRTAGVVILPYKIQGGGHAPPVVFRYSGDTVPRLTGITHGEFCLRFVYQKYRGTFNAPLSQILLTREPPGENPQIMKQWTFQYRVAGVKQNRFLKEITIENSSRHPGALRFSYGIDQPPGHRVDWYSPNAVPRSVWKPVTNSENNNRWLLPKGKSVKGNPGLRFVKLNSDKHLDLVDTELLHRESWIWNPNKRGWDYFGGIYKPPRPSVSGKRPTGSHYSTLWKAFADDRFNTNGHQSIITAYYKPTGDNKNLEYHYMVHFPKVFNGELKPGKNGKIWEHVDKQELMLPVPLQYEGFGPWPMHMKGIHAVEAYNNQGAQFVQFTDDGFINLLYIGLRYRDAETGDIILDDASVHRNTCHCREFDETEWEQGVEGEKKTVKIDICQGFWSAVDECWSYDLDTRDQPFWERLDKDSLDRLFDWYILPWQENNPKYYHHYLGFQSIKFVTLDGLTPFMVVHAPQPVHPGGSVKDIYRLEGCRWIKQAEDSGYYPPAEAWKTSELLFVDVDGDGMDDAVIPRGPYKKTFINMGSQIEPRWRLCPAFELPVCDVVDGSARFIDLDFDEDQDLFVGTGRIVYINKSISSENAHPEHMTMFTDQFGKQRSVQLGF